MKCYTGRCKCDHIVNVVVSPDPEPEFLDGNPQEHKNRYRKDAAKEVYEMIMQGLTVELMDADEARDSLKVCICS